MVVKLFVSLPFQCNFLVDLGLSGAYPLDSTGHSGQFRLCQLLEKRTLLALFVNSALHVHGSGVHLLRYSLGLIDFRYGPSPGPRGYPNGGERGPRQNEN